MRRAFARTARATLGGVLFLLASSQPSNLSSILGNALAAEFHATSDHSWAQSANYKITPAVGITDAKPVSTKLVLCMDGSSSMTDDEYALQLQGTADAFLDEAVQQQIVLRKGLAVKVIEFDINALTQVDWKILRTRADIALFAAELRGLKRVLDNATFIDSCVAQALEDIRALPNPAEYSVIDVSSDEYSVRSSEIMSDLRKKAVKRGVQINGLALKGVEDYPNQNKILIEGMNTRMVTPEGFVEVAKGAADFRNAMIRKLCREIGGLNPFRFFMRG